MSVAATITTELPTKLIEALHASDEQTRGQPVLPASERQRALAWLRCVLVDFESLDRHIRLLQRLYQSEYRYPRPRRDAWAGDLLATASATSVSSRFRHTEMLDDDRIAGLADSGVDRLSDQELARLLLNPNALFDLHDVLNELHPDAWLPVMHEVGHAVLQREKIAPAARPPLPASSEPAAAEAKTANNGIQRTRLPPGEEVEVVSRRSPAWWAGWATAGATLLAASLLLGVFLGQRMGGGGPGNGGTEQLLASAKVIQMEGPRKGKVPGVRVTSTFAGFATIIALSSAEDRLDILPGVGGANIPVEGDEGGAAEIPWIEEEPEPTDLLIVVTQTPADGSIRRLVQKNRDRARTIADLETFLAEELKKQNYKRLAFTRAKLGQGKK